VIVLRPAARDLRRVLSLEGIDNFRDLGGIPAGDGRVTKSGVLFRSGTWSAASSQDLARLAGLGIRAVVDLREPEVQRAEPDRLPAGARALPMPMSSDAIERFKTVWHAVKAGGEGDTEGRRLHLDIYREFPDDMADHARRLVEALCDPRNLPLALHCTAGKDRTGFLCTLILAALGVSRALAMRDYLLTNWCRRAFVDRVAGGCARPRFARLFLEARPQYLAAAFEVVRERHGSLEAYLAARVGVTGEVRARLCDALLQGAGALAAPPFSQ
jgi:protein-tyrosine phosphatase